MKKEVKKGDELWESLSIKQDTKDEFEQLRFKFHIKLRQQVSQDRFIKILLNLYKIENKNLLKQNVN